VVVICIFLTTILWLLNALNKDYTTKISYPIHIDYNESQVIATEEPPENVEVNVSGYGWNLFRKTVGFRVDPLVIALENPAYTKFLTAGQLYPAINEQLRDVRLNYIIMDTMYLSFEERVKSKVPLRVDSQNISLAENYRIVSDIRLSPDSVEFEGAVSRLSALPKFILLSVPGKNIDSDYNHTITLDYPDVPFVKLNDKQVNISFKTALFTERAHVVPITFVNFPEKALELIEDTNVTVSYFYNDQLRPLTEADTFEVVLNYKKLNPQDSTIIPEITKKPAGIYDVSVQPSAIKLEERIETEAIE
jgi:hypothetical protein